MASLCQTDYAVVRPTEYFPETFITGTCDACGEDAFVGRVTKAEADEARAVFDSAFMHASHIAAGTASPNCQMCANIRSNSEEKPHA